MSGARARLKDLAALNPETLTDATDPEFAFRYIDIGSASRGYLRHEPEFLTFGVAPSRARRVLRPGDTILSTVRTYLRAAWTVREAPDQLVASTGFVCLRPRQGVNARYLGWLVQSDVVVEEVVARSVGVSYPAINPVEVGRIEVHHPSPARQLAIADYLDRETAHIEELIAARRALAGLLDERDNAVLSRLLVPARHKMAHLRFFASIQSGLTVDMGREPGNDAVTLPYLRVANVQAGHLDLRDVAEIAIPWSLAARTQLRRNDVLMTEGGDIDKLGRGTVWTAEIDTCLHQNHVFAVRPDPRRLDPWYLALLTRTAHGRSYFESTGAQSTNLASTSSAKIMNFPIPVMSVNKQRTLVAQWRKETTPTTDLRRALASQTDLLQERRQALITAAVTGELDIPEAA